MLTDTDLLPLDELQMETRGCGVAQLSLACIVASLVNLAEI